ncbi:MAG: 1-acyl-sn-glycerol-3-phosphate acyltransferase [Thermodesulfobacteriota bacterium]|nr:1-acyl-sn-glycerol-3-phosphate acyltransferase [Thermodesulfobacteriota bacterium]
MRNAERRDKKFKRKFSLINAPRLALGAVGLVMMTLILAPPLILISLLTASGRPAYLIGTWWAYGVARGMGLTFSIRGKEKITPGASYIITPNHQGNADILALFRCLPTPFRWVIKKELLKIPLFGPALGRTGAIAIDRSNSEKAIKSLEEGKKKLEGGWSVVIYPEGTRSPDENLQPFKKGAFMMAVQTGIPILPVTCNGAFRVLPKKTIFFLPGHIEVVIADPIQTEGLTQEDVPDLIERTRLAMLSNLDTEFDPFDGKARSNSVS